MKKHPDLGKKLRLLYSLRFNQEINNNAELSRALGVSRQAVGSWVKGTSTRLGDRIPDDKVEKVVRAFGIHSYWLTLSYARFEKKVRAKAAADDGLPPAPPDRISVSLMPLTGGELFGRRRELEALNKAWNSARVNVVQVLGFGGLGKSALINGWLSRLAREGYGGARHVYAWSFLQQGAGGGASGDDMIDHALEWFGDPQPASGTVWSKVGRLAGLIRSRKTLFILDGLEALQRPPGPAQGQIGCAALTMLLRELAADMHGLCLVSSRLGLADLASYSDERVHTMTLQPLNRSAGVRTLKSLGVSGDGAWFMEAARVHGGHPLSLQMVAEHSVGAPAGPLGQGRRPARLTDILIPATPAGSHALRISRAYLDWFAGGPEGQLLYILGLMGRPVRFEELFSLSRMEELEGLTDRLFRLNKAGLHAALARLEAAGLISLRTVEGGCWLACHPLLRVCIDLILKTEDPARWGRTHGLIFHHLKLRLLAGAVEPPSVEVMFSAVAHGVKANRLMDAFRLYLDKIKKGLPMLPRGSHLSDHACLRLFFEREWDRPLGSFPAAARFQMLSSAAANLMMLGRLDEVMEPARTNIRNLADSGMVTEATNVTLPLVTTLITAGELDESAAVLAELKTMVSAASNPLLTAVYQTFAGFIAHLRGDRRLAALMFRNAHRVIGRPDPPAEAEVSIFSAYHCRFLLETEQYQKAFERASLTFKWRERGAWQTAHDTTSIHARDMRVLGQACLAIGEHDRAGALLNEQVSLLRSTGELLCLPTALGSRARYHIETGKMDDAAADLAEALNTAAAIGMRLAEWETYLDLARLNLATGNTPQASDYLLKAREMPAMEGFKFRDKEIHRMHQQIKHLGG